MEFLSNGYTLEIPAGCFPLSTDSILLAQFVHLPKTPGSWTWDPDVAPSAPCCAHRMNSAM